MVLKTVCANVNLCFLLQHKTTKTQTPLAGAVTPSPSCTRVRRYHLSPAGSTHGTPSFGKNRISLLVLSWIHKEVLTTERRLHISIASNDHSGRCCEFRNLGSSVWRECCSGMHQILTSIAEVPTHCRGNPQNSHFFFFTIKSILLLSNPQKIQLV